jgi:hypothetical protein
MKQKMSFQNWFLEKEIVLQGCQIVKFNGQILKSCFYLINILHFILQIWQHYQTGTYAY